MGYSGGDRRIRRPKIIIDTNMLLLLADGINVFEQIEEKLSIKPEYIVLKPILEELEKLANSNKLSIRRKASFVLRILKNYCKIIDVDEELSREKNVDDIILKYAEKHQAVVATNDKDLRRKLRRKGLPEIYLREESMRIDVEGLEL